MEHLQSSFIQPLTSSGFFDLVRSCSLRDETSLGVLLLCCRSFPPSAGTALRNSYGARTAASSSPTSLASRTACGLLECTSAALAKSLPRDSICSNIRLASLSRSLLGSGLSRRLSTSASASSTLSYAFLTFSYDYSNSVQFCAISGFFLNAAAFTSKLLHYLVRTPLHARKLF